MVHKENVFYSLELLVERAKQIYKIEQTNNSVKTLGRSKPKF